MKLVSEDIEQYCLTHSTRPSAHCEAIDAYTKANVPISQMVTGPLVGSFLGFLIRLSGARRVLEVGCFTGYSALAMAEQLPEGGEVVTLDINPETMAIARGFWKQSPHGSRIHPIIGPALQTIQTLEAPFDLVFIDADKKNYLNYFRKALELTPINGLIVVDNVLWSGRVVDKSVDNFADEDTRGIRELNDWVAARADLRCTLLPVRDGLLLVRKQG